MGTPITGRTVSAATTPAKWAAAPAPAIKTLTPRLRHWSTYFLVRAGLRCADETVTSFATPN